jgi:hypothetical protein
MRPFVDLVSVLDFDDPASALTSAAAPFPWPAACLSTFAETFLGDAEETLVDLWVALAEGEPPRRLVRTALSVA